MPRCRSYVQVLQSGGSLSQEQEARFKRDTYYRQKTLVLQNVPKELHGPIRDMANGRILHQAMADATMSARSSGKATAHLAFKQGHLDRSMYHSVRKKLDDAGAGKHNVAPASCGIVAAHATGDKYIMKNSVMFLTRE